MYRYQLYDPANETYGYGTRFDSIARAMAFAQKFTTIFKHERWVIDTETGEILAMYNNGLLTESAERA